MENKCFQRYQRILNPKVNTLDPKSALDELRKIEKLIWAMMGAMLEGQNILMTHDSWTDSGNRTYVSATYSSITED